MNRGHKLFIYIYNVYIGFLSMNILSCLSIPNFILNIVILITFTFYSCFETDFYHEHFLTLKIALDAILA